MDAMNGFARIVFKPGICSDDGRALTGWWDVYTSDSLHAHFWNEPEMFKTEEDARAWCAGKHFKVASVSWT